MYSKMKKSALFYIAIGISIGIVVGFSVSAFTHSFSSGVEKSSANEESIAENKLEGLPISYLAELTPAQRFISGENIVLPASYGASIDNEFILPPKEFTDALKQTKKGFNLKEAMSTRDSLESILKALDIEGDNNQTHGKLIKNGKENNSN